MDTGGGGLLSESPVASFEMAQSDFLMEQCISRPPEKVLIMPSSTSSTARSPPPTTNKKSRSSLFSIISGGDKKSPNPSVSSSNEDPVSPPCTSPAADITQSSTSPPCASPAANVTLSSSQASKLSPEPGEQEADVAPPVQEKPTKKVPPPTLAKTFKTKSFSKTPTPSPTAESTTILSPLGVRVSVPPTVTEVVETTDKLSNEKTLATEVPVASDDVKNSSGRTANTISSPSSETAQYRNYVESDNTTKEIVVSDTTKEKSQEIEREPQPAVVTDATNGIGDQLPSEDVDLPPPIELDAMPEIDECDNMEFPPPPEVESLTDVEPDLNNVTPTISVEARVELEGSEVPEGAGSQIESNPSTAAVPKDNTELHNNVTKDADPDSEKHTISIKRSRSDSEDMHEAASHQLNNITMEQSTVSAHDTQLATVEVDHVTTRTDLQINRDQPGQEPVKLEVQDIAAKDSSPEPLSAGEKEMPPSGRVDSELMDNSETETGDSDSINHLISPPTLPVTSSFSALDTNVSTHATNARQDGRASPDHTGGSLASDTGKENEHLTVSQHMNDSGRASSATSPVPQSPQFNTSSESGDSGVESGVCSLVGETVTVKLRSTINDNRKPESAVPMFDRNSSELKRVTFREATNQVTSTVVTTRRSAAEEERIKRTGLSEDDISQAELFYKGHKTEVMVCPCLATLYMAESRSSENIPMESWKPEHIGIPVLIFDTGTGKRHCGLTMVFAEKGTGFLLWRTTINYESRWEVVEPVFHQLRIKGDTFAGIAFQDESSAGSFYNYFKTCTADPEQNVLNNPNLRNNKKSKKDKKKSVKRKVTPLPNKSAISKPCEFTHVTQLKQSVDGLMAAAMIPVEEEEGSEDGKVKFA